jgi:hypothetical protein
MLFYDRCLVTPTEHCNALYDNAIAISSEDNAKIKEAYEIAGRFDLKRTSIRILPFSD